MTSPFVPIAAVTAVGALYVVLPVVIDAYQRFRGTKTVSCPDDGSGDIQLDVAAAARSAAFGRPHLRIVNCSRWPEQQQCDRGCLSQLR